MQVLVHIWPKILRCHSCQCATKGDQCSARMRLYDVMSRYFKFSDFRDGQLEAMLPVLHGNDTFVHMATGSGKSVCMFLPLLASGDLGMGVIISPLNALMDRQVLNLFIKACWCVIGVLCTPGVG